MPNDDNMIEYQHFWMELLMMVLQTQFRSSDAEEKCMPQLCSPMHLGEIKGLPTVFIQTVYNFTN